MNAVNIVGRLARDPEFRRTEDGKAVCDLRFALDDPVSKNDRSDFITVTAFGVQAENCDKYLRKGYLAGVTGRIRSDVYTDADGIKRYPVKIMADRIQYLDRPERSKEPGTEEPACEPEQSKAEESRYEPELPDYER